MLQIWDVIQTRFEGYTVQSCDKIMKIMFANIETLTKHWPLSKYYPLSMILICSCTNKIKGDSFFYALPCSWKINKFLFSSICKHLLQLSWWTNFIQLAQWDSYILVVKTFRRNHFHIIILHTKSFWQVIRAPI